MELLLRRASSVNLFSALTSEIQRATNGGEIRRGATLLNSGDVATLFAGTRHAPVKAWTFFLAARHSNCSAQEIRLRSTAGSNSKDRE
jgi:hypothetical protein